MSPFVYSLKRSQFFAVIAILLADIGVVIAGSVVLTQFESGLLAFENGGQGSYSTSAMLAGGAAVTITAFGAYSSIYTLRQALRGADISIAFLAGAASYAFLRAAMVVAMGAAAWTDGFDFGATLALTYFVATSLILTWALLPVFIGETRKLSRRLGGGSP